ncbi:MAG: DUF59 domain-containing protein [Opitutales bacterium]|nr:DUF59 domain-containing protein [Opitutales bacterium]
MEKLDLKNIKLLRECSAMLIPAGVKVLLAKDNIVEVTHRLGGNYTVRGIFGMARIEGKDADALGLQPEDSNRDSCSTATEISNERQAKTSDAPTQSTLEESDIWEAAKTVYDPEIPVNIVDLGLVYRLQIFDEENGTKRVEADMTLTAPGCSMGPMIAEDLRMRIESLPSVSQASVNIVWDPPWNKDMMSEEARMILGLA